MDGQDLTAAETELVRRFALNPYFDYQSMTELKRSLAKRLGAETGFARWRQLIPREKFPDADRVEATPILSLRTAAQQSSVCVDVAASGIAFEIRPPKVIGDGDHHVMRNTSRAVYLTRLSNARIRGGSDIIHAKGSAIVDVEELELVKAREFSDVNWSTIDFDPSVFFCDPEAWVAWMLVPAEDRLELERAYSLAGPNAMVFGHWMGEYLPKYVMASMTGCLPPVPIVIDSNMPNSHRQALELLAPDGVDIIERPIFSTTCVRELWVGSNLGFPEITKRWDPYASDPAVYAPILTEMACRLERAIPQRRGPDKVYLSRKALRRRKLVNASAIEEIAREAGFVIAHPQDLSFAEQFRLVRDASFVLGPDGSAMFLCFFNRPGTRLCILNHTHTEGLPTLTGLLSEISLDVTVLTGPIVRQDENHLHFSDYEIDVDQFRNFLAEWLEGSSAERKQADSAVR